MPGKGRAIQEHLRARTGIVSLVVCGLLVAIAGCGAERPMERSAPATRAASTTTSAASGTSTSGEHPPVEGSWRRLPDPPLSPRRGSSVVWTGSSLVVFAGHPASGWTDQGRADGAVYHVVSGTWQTLPPSPLGLHMTSAAVWTDAEIVAWGGLGRDGAVNDGAAWDPQRNTWRELPPSPLAAREHPHAVWSGTEMIVWGGAAGYGGPRFGDGAAFNPAVGTWRKLPPAPIQPRWLAAAAWTGREMLVWGGKGDSGPEFADGAAYDPMQDTWRVLAPGPLSGRAVLNGVWTGRELLLIAGMQETGAGGGYQQDGAAYDPATDRWRPVESPPLPPGMALDTAHAWTGSEAIVSAHLGESSRWLAYNPGTDAWRHLPDPPRVENFAHHTVWTGTELLAWGPVLDCLYSDCIGEVTGQAFLRFGRQ